MAYKIIVSSRAQMEIENAIDYYALYSADAPINFIAALKEGYNSLVTNPFFRVRHKNVRASEPQKISSFPLFCNQRKPEYHQGAFLLPQQTKP